MYTKTASFMLSEIAGSLRDHAEAMLTIIYLKNGSTDQNCAIQAAFENCHAHPIVPP